MPLRRLLRAPVVSAGILLLIASCGDDAAKPVPSADEFFFECGGVAPGDRFTSDEAFERIQEKESARAFVEADTTAPVLIAPESDTISALTPPTFTIAPKITMKARPSWLRRAWAWLNPISTAHAHCTGVSGDNFLFRLSDASGTAVYTAMLSVESFTPGQVVWRNKLKTVVGKPLTLTLVRAGFTGGSITDGPFVAKTKKTFTVGAN